MRVHVSQPQHHGAASGEGEQPPQMMHIRPVGGGKHREHDDGPVDGPRDGPLASEQQAFQPRARIHFLAPWRWSPVVIRFIARSFTRIV
jgi:hypothetical protein